MGVGTAQAGGKSLSAVYALRGQGDWHPNLDRPANGIFQASDFRLRIELTGKGVALEDAEPDRWTLEAGRQRAVVHGLPVILPGGPSSAVGRGDDQVFVNAICYHGPRQAFNFQHVPQIELAAGIEILSANQVSSEPRRISANQSPKSWKQSGRSRSRCGSRCRRGAERQ